MNGREQFEKYYHENGGCLLATVKENHWRTWLAAQVALLEAHGPAVEMRTIPDGELERLNWEKAHD